MRKVIFPENEFAITVKINEANDTQQITFTENENRCTLSFLSHSIFYQITFSKKIIGEIDGKPIAFDFIGRGSYNVIFHFNQNENDYVIRIPFREITSHEKNIAIIANQPTRVHRMWKEEKKLQTEIVSLFKGKNPFLAGLIVPYFKKVGNATTSQIVDAMVDYYFSNNGRVILDAFAKDNIIQTEAGFICVDIAFAVRPVAILKSDDDTDELEKSMTSDEFMTKMKSAYKKIWIKKSDMHEVYCATRALLWMQKLYSMETAKKLLATPYQDYLFLLMGSENHFDLETLMCESYLSFINLFNTILFSNQKKQNHFFTLQIVKLISMAETSINKNQIQFLFYFLVKSWNEADPLFQINVDLNKKLMQLNSVLLFLSLKNLSIPLLCESIWIFLSMMKKFPINQSMIDHLRVAQNIGIRNRYSTKKSLQLWHATLLPPPKPIDFEDACKPVIW